MCEVQSKEFCRKLFVVQCRKTCERRIRGCFWCSEKGLLETFGKAEYHNLGWTIPSHSNEKNLPGTHLGPLVPHSHVLLDYAIVTSESGFLFNILGE